jgi:hypothetical protein
MRTKKDQARIQNIHETIIDCRVRKAFPAKSGTENAKFPHKRKPRDKASGATRILPGNSATNLWKPAQNFPEIVRGIL